MTWESIHETCIHQTIQRQQQSAGKHAHILEPSVQPRHAMQQYMDNRQQQRSESPSDSSHLACRDIQGGKVPYGHILKKRMLHFHWRYYLSLPAHLGIQMSNVYDRTSVSSRWAVSCHAGYNYMRRDYIGHISLSTQYAIMIRWKSYTWIIVPVLK